MYGKIYKLWTFMKMKRCFMSKKIKFMAYMNINTDKMKFIYK